MRRYLLLTLLMLAGLVPAFAQSNVSGGTAGGGPTGPAVGCTSDGVNPTRCPNGINTATNGDYEEYTVDTGGVTAGLALCATSNVDASGRPKVLPCSHVAAQPGAGFVGIAKTTVAAAGTVAVCWTVNCAATFDNGTTALNEAILSITTDGQFHDTGAQTATAGQPNFSILNANGGSGNALVSLTGMLAQNPKGGGGNGKGGGINTVNSASGPAISIVGTGSANVTTATNTITISGVNGPASPNVQTIASSSYTVANSDNSWRDKFTSGSAVSVTLPQANTIASSPFVATRAGTNTGTCTTCTSTTFAQNAGDWLIVHFNWNNAVTIVGTPTDLAGDTFVRMAPDNLAGSTNQSVWYAKAISASASNSVSFTLSGAGSFSVLQVYEYNLVAFDSSAPTVSGGGIFANPPASLTIPLSFSNEVVLGFDYSGSVGNCPSGWTSRGGVTSAMCEKLLNSTATSTYAYTAGSGQLLLETGGWGIASSPQFTIGWQAIFEAVNSAVTITPTTSHILYNNVSYTSFIIAKGTACSLMSDGTDYDATCWTTTYGLPGAVHSTGNTGVINTATLCASSPGACVQAGQYKVDFSFIETGTACATPGTGGVTLLLTWTDTNGTAHSAVSLPMDDASALNVVSQTFHFQTTLAAAYASGNFVISTNGSVIQYATGYTACGAGTGTYQLDASVTRLQY